MLELQIPLCIVQIVFIVMMMAMKQNRMNTNYSTFMSSSAYLNLLFSGFVI